MERWAELARQAAAQHRVFAAWQAAELGIGSSVLAERVEHGGLQRIRNKLYLEAEAPLTPEARIVAVLLAAREPVLPAGRAVAYLWGLIGRLRDPIDVVVPEWRDIAVRGASVHHFRHFDRLHLLVQRGITVPTAAQSVCLFAVVASIDELVLAISTADRKRVATIGEVRAAMDDLGRFKGIRRLRTALDRCGAGLVHSDLERIGRERLQEAGLRPHRRPYTVLDDAGRFLAEVDIAFIAEKVAVEVFGKPHEGQEQADHDRRRRLERAGWIVVVVYEHRLLHEPQEFVAQVRAALSERRNPKNFSA